MAQKRKVRIESSGFYEQEPHVRSRVHEIPTNAKRVRIQFHSSSDTGDVLDEMQKSGVPAKRDSHTAIVVSGRQLRPTKKAINRSGIKPYWVSSSKPRARKGLARKLAAGY